VAALTAMVSTRVGSRIKRSGMATPEVLPRHEWRMPPLSELPPVKFTLASRIWMFALRAYLMVAGGLVLLRILQLAITG
jgi:hypothetical protein